MINILKKIFASSNSSIRAEISEEKPNQHFLYGVVGDDITASQVIETLKSASGDIELHLFSVGGDLFEASAIHGILNQYPGKVTIYVEGLAASAAAFIAVAADELVMEENAMFMIHNAWKIASGNHKELREQADLVEKQQEAMVKAFIAKSGKTRDEIIDLMDEETWMDANETLEAGFADRIYANENRIAAKIDMNSLNLNFKNIPNKLIESKSKPKSKDMNVSKENLAKLGLSEDATEEEFNEALANAKLANEAGASGEGAEAGASEQGEGEAPKANSDDNPNAELMAKINSLEEKLSEREKAEETEKAEALVNSAIEAGKILPAHKNAWLTAAKADYTGTKESLDEIKANSVMPGKVSVPNGSGAGGNNEKEDTFANAVNFLKPQIAASKKSA